MNVPIEKALKVALIATSLLVATQAQGAKASSSPPSQINKPILGLVVLNKTTLGEFANKFEEQGCTVNYDNGMAEIDAGCIQLPGNPKIRAITSLKDNDEAIPWESPRSLKKLPPEWSDLKIESLALYTRDYKAWKEYLESLSNSWGKPTSAEGYDGSSGSYALWKKNNLDILLKRLSGYTWITYISTDRMKRLEEAKLAKEKIKQQNLGLL